MSADRPKLKRPVAISELLTTSFAGKPTAQRLQEGKIWVVWEAVVGAQIASKASPVAFRDGTLVVAVANAPWLQQLNFMKKEIGEKLNARLGIDLVRDIQLRAGNITPPAAAKPSKKSPRMLSSDETSQISKETSAIVDPELRNIFTLLLSKHLTAKQDDDQLPPPKEDEN